MNLPSWLILVQQGDGDGSAPQGPPAGGPPSSDQTTSGTTSGTESPPPAKKEEQGQNPYSFLILMGGMFVLLWFFMLGPERRRKKAHQARLSAVKEKDHVMTMGGIFGQVIRLEDDVLTLCIDEKRGTTMKITRSAISNILNEETEPKQG